MCGVPNDSSPVFSKKAASATLRLIYESLSALPDEPTAKWFMAVSAAICGYDTLWTKLQWLDDSQVECPKCGENIGTCGDA